MKKLLQTLSYQLLFSFMLIMIGFGQNALQANELERERSTRFTATIIEENLKSSETVDVWSENFDNVSEGELPSGWSATHQNWSVQNTSAAGGASAPELRFHWSPQTEENPRAITSLIDASNLSTVELSYMQSVDYFDNQFDLDLFVSLDGENWNLLWYMTVEDDLPPHLIELELNDLAGEEFYLAFGFWGDSYDVNNWYIDDIVVRGVASDDDDSNIIWSENFNGVESGTLPSGWSETHEHWSVQNTNYAGGASAPELRFHWSPQTEENPRVITSLIDARGFSTVALSYMQSVDYYDNQFDLDLFVSLDGENWNLLWYMTVEDDLNPHLIELELNDLAGEEFYLAFGFWGNSFDLNNWYIDDIVVRGVASDDDDDDPNNIWNVAEIAESQMNINLFPNPVSHNLNITSKENIEQIRILDLSGKIILNTSVNDSQATINVSELNQGIYIMQAITSKGAISRKFTVQ